MDKPNLFLRMSKSIVTNIELKIVAALLACLLWFIIANLDDPITTRTYFSIPVTLLNEDIITNEGKMLTIVDGSLNVNVIIRANESILDEIGQNQGSIIATADISQIELSSLVPITITVQGFERRIQSATANPTNLQVKIEDIEWRTFPIAANVSGAPGEGYVIGEVYATPESISITGPESLINSIGRVEARANAAGIIQSQSLTAELVVLDEAGDRMNLALFPSILEGYNIYVNVEVLETQLVPVEFSEIKDVPEGYVVTNIFSEPRYILVAGSAEDLRDLTEILIDSEAIELGEDVGIHEITLNVRPHLPEGIVLVDERANMIVVSIAIEREGTRTFELPVDTISVSNLPEGFTVSFETGGITSFVVSGEQRVLDGLDLRNYVSIDLATFTNPGEFNVSVNVELPFNVRLLRGDTVRITLEKIENED